MSYRYTVLYKLASLWDAAAAQYNLMESIKKCRKNVAQKVAPYELSIIYSAEGIWKISKYCKSI